MGRIWGSGSGESASEGSKHEGKENFMKTDKIVAFSGPLCRSLDDIDGRPVMSDHIECSGRKSKRLVAKIPDNGECF